MPVAVTSGPTQTVNFQTTLVTLNLLDHTGSLISGTSGTGGYYSGGWYTMGSTGSTGQVSKELLPGSGYYFNMNYNNYTQQMPVAVTNGPTQTVYFQTTLVTLNLLDHTGALITGTSGTGGWYSGGWFTMGSTGSTGQVTMEFLPGSGYYFNMNYHNGIQQIGSLTVNSGSPWTQTINFQTSLINIHFQGNTGIPHTGAAIGYYSGGWYTLGTTDGSGNVSMEMLPVPYYYNGALTGYGSTQIGSFTDAAGTSVTHVIVSSVAARHSVTDTTESSAPNVGEATSEKINVYPNPAHDLIYISIPAQYKTAELHLFDVTGKEVQMRSVEENTGTPVQMTLNNLTPGIYYLRILAGGQNTDMKLLVK